MIFNDKFLVVVVDSNDESLTNVSRMFKLEGFDVEKVKTIDELQYCLAEEKPNLIVVNFGKEQSKNKEIFLEIRGDERYFDLPFLGIVDVESADELDEYYELGIDDIVKEPISKQELLLRGENLIELSSLHVNVEKKDSAITTILEDVKMMKLELNRKNLEIKNLKDTLNRVMVLDAVTGLFNRGYAIEQLEMAISRFNRNEIKSSILLCNIDNYGNISQSIGHQMMDRVLRELALSLSSNKRNQDIFARYNNDTFIVVLPDTDVEGAKFFAERGRSIIDKSKFNKRSLNLTMTFGVATYEQTMPLEMLVKMAEDAVEIGKSEGGNIVIVANEKLELKSEE